MLLKWEELPGPGGALGGGEKERGTEGGGTVQTTSDTVRLHDQEILHEGNSVEEFRECHLLLLRDAAQLREH